MGRPFGVSQNWFVGHCGRQKLIYMDNLIYGRHPVVEALENGKRFDKLFLQKGVEAAFSRQIQQLAHQNNVLVQVVPIEKMNRLTTKNHQGIAGFLSVVVYYELSDLLIQAFEKGETPLFLLFFS